MTFLPLLTLYWYNSGKEFYTVNISSFLLPMYTLSTLISLGIPELLKLWACFLRIDCSFSQLEREGVTLRRE
jgi:hypothetical protein